MISDTVLANDPTNRHYVERGRLIISTLDCYKYIVNVKLMGHASRLDVVVLSLFIGIIVT